MTKLTNYLKILGAIAGTVYILHVNEFFVVPIIWSIIICYFIITLSSEIYRIPWFNGKFPFWVSTFLANLIFVSVFVLLGGIITGSANEIIKVLPDYQARLLEIIQNVFTFLGIAEPESLKSLINSDDLNKVLTFLGTFFKNSSGRVAIVVIYVIFLLLEYHTFEKKLMFIVPNRIKRRKLLNFTHQITDDLKTYLAIKSGTSFATGVISYLFLSLIGVDFALFWALLIFLLNYIPTVGSIIAVIFPLLVSLVQFDGFLHFGLTATCLIATQVAIGNILEPRLMGKSLNLSPFVIILSLGVWKAILGVTGMFLCVPFMVILNLILSNFESTKPIAVLLSANGKIVEKKS